MKNRAFAALAALLLLLSLTACGGEEKPGAPVGGISPGAESGAGPQSTPAAPPEESRPPEEPDPFVEVALGETVTVAGVDFTFELQDTANELRPAAAQGGNYSFLGEREGYTLFYVKITVTNNSDTDYYVSWIECKCAKNGGDPSYGPKFYIDNKFGLSDAGIVAPGETYTCYLAERLYNDWLENEYESYRFLFSLPESQEAVPERLESGYGLTIRK